MRRYKITLTEGGVNTMVGWVGQQTAINDFNNLYKSIKARADIDGGVRIVETPDSYTFHYPKSERLPNGYTITLKIEEETINF